jgi:hypothetical protein
MENCRKFKALMIDSEYKNNQLPSGKNHKDFAEFIRKEFYCQEKIPVIKKKQEEKAKKKAEQFWAAYGFDQHEIESVADDNNNADDDDDTEVEAEEAAADNSQEAEEEVEADDPDQKYFDKMGNYCPAGLPAFLLSRVPSCLMELMMTTEPRYSLFHQNSCKESRNLVVAAAGVARKRMAGAAFTRKSPRPKLKKGQQLQLLMEGATIHSRCLWQHR